MDHDSLLKVVSVKNDVRAAIYNLEKTLEAVKGSFLFIEDVLYRHCSHDWSTSDDAPDLCRLCGAERRPEDCNHVWVMCRGCRDRCLKCAVVKTPSMCVEHEWVEGPEDADHKRDFFCARCGRIQE